MSEIGRISGLTELYKKFDELPIKIEKKVARSAMRKAAKPIVYEAKSKVPVKTGELKASIKIKGAKTGFQKRQQRAGLLFLNIKASVLKKYKNGMRHVDVASKIEYGTSKTAPQPFMRPAFDMYKGEVLNIFVDELKNNLEEVLK